jgi:hypothetical protein
MRWAIAAVALLIAGVAAAQPLRRYDVYLYDPGDGREIYAFAAAGRAAAVEVRGCGDVSLIGDAATLVREMRALRRTDENVITVSGRGSHTELGPCGAVEEEVDAADEQFEVDDYLHQEPETSLVILEDMSPTQTRDLVRSMDAASVAVREQLLVQLGL